VKTRLLKNKYRQFLWQGGDWGVGNFQRRGRKELKKKRRTLGTGGGEKHVWQRSSKQAKAGNSVRSYRVSYMSPTI